MKDKIELQTKVGTLEVLTERDPNFPGILIKLNGVPVTFIEQIKDGNEYKLIQKDYDNKKITRPIDGINYEKYQIDLNEVEKLKKEMDKNEIL